MKRLLFSTFFLVLTINGYSQKEGDLQKFKLNKNISIDMVYIPSGKFMMGSPENELERNPAREKQHLVTLTKGYWMATTETTQEVWKKIMGENPSKIINPLHPVEQVSWDEVQIFLNVINKSGSKFRLPYEAEWEYACRAGTTTSYAGKRDQMTWHSGNSYRTSHPVATKKANQWGLYDMHGNVSEMCQDWFHEDISADAIDPKGPSSGEKKVERGGQYTGRIRHTRSADRSRDIPSESTFYVGFRLVHE